MNPSGKFFLYYYWTFKNTKFNSKFIYIYAFVYVGQGRGKVFYVGGGGAGGGGVVNFCVEILRQIETENRAIAYALSWDRVRQQLAILQMGIGYNEFI